MKSLISMSFAFALAGCAQTSPDAAPATPPENPNALPDLAPDETLEDAKDENDPLPVAGPPRPDPNRVNPTNEVSPGVRSSGDHPPDDLREP